MRDGQFRSEKIWGGADDETRDLVGQDPIGVGSSGKRSCINLLLPSRKGSESTGSSLVGRGLCAPFFVCYPIKKFATFRSIETVRFSRLCFNRNGN